MKRGYTKRLFDAALRWKEKAGQEANTGKMEITIETHKVLVVHRRGSFQGWCAQCADRVDMVRPEDASAFLQISLRRVFRRVEAEKLHYTETADGLLFICRNSLMNLSKEVVRNRPVR